MIKTRLIRMLSSLSSNELRRIDDFVRSPYFNKNEEVYKLFSYIKDQHPKFSGKNMDPLKVFNYLYPGEKYSDPKLRKIRSKLTSLIEEYFAVSMVLYEVDGKKIESIPLIVQKLMSMHEYELAARKLLEYEKEILGLQDYVPDMLSHRAALRRYQLVNIRYMHRGQNPANYVDLQNIFFETEDDFLYHYLLYYSYVYNCNKIYNSKISLARVEKIIESVIDKVPDISPATESLIALYKMYIGDDVKSFNQAKKFIASNISILDTNSKVTFYIELENFCKRKVWQGKEKYLKFEFEIYKEEVKHKLHLDQQIGHISFILLVRIVDLGLIHREYDWTIDFYNTHIELTDKSVRESIRNYCDSLFAFYNKDYDLSIEKLSLVNYDSYYSKIDLRLLKLMIYYEMEMWQPLTSLVDSTRHFIGHSDTISNDWKPAYSNFVTGINTLYKTKVDPNKEVPKKSKIVARKCLRKDWLRSKHAELKADK